MWDKCCRGNIGGDSGQVTCEVRGHIKRNSTTARPKTKTKYVTSYYSNGLYVRKYVH